MTSYYAYCYSCHSLPWISIIKDDEYKVHVKCPCGEDKDYDLSSYVQTITKSEPHYCSNKKKHQQKEATTRCCLTCNKWICSQCYEDHNNWTENHVEGTDKHEPRNFCTKHVTNKYEAFCFDCKVHYCEDCAHRHLNHNIVKLNEVMTDQRKKEIEDCFNQAKNKFASYAKPLKERYVNMLQTQIDRIENAYKKTDEINKNLITLFQAFLNSYNKSKVNYQTMDNLLQNCKFGLNELVIDNELTMENIDKVVTYIENALITKGKQALHEALSLKKTIPLDRVKEIKQIFFLDDNKVVLCGRSGTLVYERKSMRFLYEVNYSESNDVTLCGKDTLLIAVGKQVQIYTLLDNRAKCLGEFTYHKDTVTKVIKISEERAASCSDEFEIRLWSLVPPYKQIIKLKGHTSYVTQLLELSYKPILVSGSMDKQLRFWDLTPPSTFMLTGYKCVNVIPDIEVNGFSAMVEMKDKKLLVGNKGGVMIVDIERLVVVKEVKDLMEENISSFIVLMDGTIFVSGATKIMRIDQFSLGEIYTKKNVSKTQIVKLLQTKDNEFISANSTGEIKEWEFTYN